MKERSAAQEHFIDLCRLVGHPTPAEADPTGATFCFEKGAAKHGGLPAADGAGRRQGFADVWKKNFFAFEYKGKHKELGAAYDQLLLYRDALESPPLLVCCDLDRIVVHTNFTGTASATNDIALDRLGEPRNLEVLRAIFHDPEKLRPGRTSEAITQDAAEQFAGIAESMRKRGLDSAVVAHFLDRVVFCLFAEDIGLLPDQIFTRIVDKAAGDPAKFRRFMGQLFDAMARGGEFGLESIRHFNGNLFDSTACPDLTAEEAKRIADTPRLDWSAVDPSIFGTLFERGLDPAKRSQLGAHFTGKDDIVTLVDAVIMRPLRREWADARQIIETVLATGKKKPGATPAKPLTASAQRKARGEAESILHQFLVRLQTVKVLDPACGSGNFLYVTLQALKDLEKAAILYSMEQGLGSFLPLVGPWQLHGIEVNPYAYDLAQMTVWIGWLQWIRFNGFGSPQEPILRAMEGNFQCRDAILDLADPANPKEPDWPKVDFIVGNPPFLGGNRIRQELGDAYVDALFRQFAGRVPAFADLCCYWFEKARAHIERGGCQRAGLLATQGIRGGANREVLKRVKHTGDIFWAISDRDWVLDGANVHVSMIAFDGGAEESRTLDGQAVARINPDLTAATDITTAVVLRENARISFQGPSPKAPFDMDAETASRLLASTGNPNGRPNSDVVRPLMRAIDIGGNVKTSWTVDFGLMPMEEAAQYSAPFEYVRRVVLPLRGNRRDDYRGCWWQYARPRPEMRKALRGMKRFIATPRHSKHRLFVWLSAELLANDSTITFAREDDYFFGVLHSRIHEVWARAQGTQLREEESGARYTPTTSFETFPLPWPPGQEPTADPRYTAIAAASRELVAKRDAWLAGVDPADRKPRTLTRLYNDRPTWLDLAHRQLDAAVAAAYGWPVGLPDEAILERLLASNAEHARRETGSAAV
ncbi:MAG: class I SAM-dependent DNA methyltransferase [Kiritimatiellae bacterium]|nr:class I SAM-dependent DNA methyltransferase [Kiritimatiellia bacterium]